MLFYYFLWAGDDCNLNLLLILNIIEIINKIIICYIILDKYKFYFKTNYLDKYIFSNTFFIKIEKNCSL